MFGWASIAWTFLTRWRWVLLIGSVAITMLTLWVKANYFENKSNSIIIKQHEAVIKAVGEANEIEREIRALAPDDVFKRLYRDWCRD